MNDGHGERGAGSWTPRATQLQRLSQLDALIGSQPDAIDAKIERAALLGAMDRRTEARQAFVDILLQAPANFSALNEFGNLLTSMGFAAAACRVYAEAVKHHPTNPTAHVNLANLLLQGGKHDRAREHYEAALTLEPEHPHAHRGLGAVIAATGDRSAARPHFDVGYRDRAISTLPYRGATAPVPLLQLVSSGDGNIPAASFVDDGIFLTTVIVADYLDPSIPLPPHRLVFNSAGDADLCAPALEAAVKIVNRTSAPIVNHPAAVLRTGRVENARRLGALPDVRAPRMAAVPRTALAAADASAMLSRQGFTFPLLLRSPGFHTGRHFIQVNDAAELPMAAGSLPGDELLAIEFLDARGADGNARKYRAMFIDGRIFPLHAAISRQWKVHYFTADMADHPAHRSEDAAFLDDMQAVIGRKAMLALARIRDTLALDYGGIDFGLSPSGDVLVFEANATMVVNPPDADERWAYRRPAVNAILDAAKAMLLRKAAPPSLRKAG